jgi:hypothetical protein
VTLAALRVVLVAKARLAVYSVLVLAVLGWLSLTALGLIGSLLQLYDGVLGTSEGLVVSSRGFSPLTALISRSEVERKISGVGNITAEYYLVAPALAGGRVVILRSSSAASGDCVLLGEELARVLGTRAGSCILASSVFTGEVYCLKVCGYTSGYVVEAPYDLVARVRGVPPGYYSYAVIRGPPGALSRVLEALGAEPGELRQASLVVAILPRISEERARPEVYRALTEAYITGLGLQRDYVVNFSLAVAVTSVLGSVVLGLDSARRMREALRVLRLVGLSRRDVLLTVTALGLAAAVAGSLSALVLYRYAGIFSLSVLGFEIKPGAPGQLALVIFSALLVLYALGLAAGVRREVE